MTRILWLLMMTALAGVAWWVYFQTYSWGAAGLAACYHIATLWGAWLTRN